MTDIDNYIAQYSGVTKEYLVELRFFIKSIIPEASEVMSYGMPTFNYVNNIVHFAGYKHHIGFYPGSDAMTHFLDDFKSYKKGKGSVQFPVKEDLPFELIETIVLYRINKNNSKLLSNPKYIQCKYEHVHLRFAKCPICLKEY